LTKNETKIGHPARIWCITAHLTTSEADDEARRRGLRNGRGMTYCMPH